MGPESGLSESDQVKLWIGRLDAAKAVYNRVKARNERLEDAVAGKFPPLVPGVEGLDPDLGVMLSTEQVDLNLMGRTASFFSALVYDEFPTLRFTRQAGTASEAARKGERFLQDFMDDMGVAAPFRRAVRSTLTRGIGPVWIHLGHGVTTPETAYTTKLAAAQLAFRAMQGEDITPGPGTDLQSVQAAAGGLLNDPAMRLSMKEQGANKLLALQVKAAQMYEKELESGVHPIQGGKARIWYDFTPYGTWCLADSMACEPSRIRWLARKVVMTRDQFMAEVAFTKHAKDNIKPIPLARMTGHISDKPPLIAGPDPAPGDLYECWNIYDKQTWECIWISYDYDRFLTEKNDYPYFNENGVPAFDGFFPCAWRTPVEDIREIPEALMGIPPLAPGWGPQLEVIKTRSAWLAGTKRSGRLFVSGKVLDEVTKERIQSGEDGTIVEPPAGYNPTMDGPLLQRVDLGNAPVDYLQASLQEKADFAMVVGIELAVLTGEPVADTLGQEQIALKGSATTQSDMIRCFESQFAELASLTATMVRTFIPDEVIQGYSVTGDAATIRQALLALQTSKITCRFASGTRAEDALRLKQIMDYLAVVNTLRSPITGLPDYDTKPIVARLAKEMDMDEPTPFEPSQSDLAMMAQMQQQQQQQQPGGPPGQAGGAPGDQANTGGNTTGRSDNGQRGPPKIPGSQDRSRRPANGSQMGGPQSRRPFQL